MTSSVYYKHDSYEHIITIGNSSKSFRNKTYVIQPNSSLTDITDLRNKLRKVYKVELTVVCDGNNCFCSELAQMFQKYDSVHIIFNHNATCCKYYTIVKYSFLTLREVVISDYIILQFPCLQLDSCDFDPNFLIATQSTTELYLTSCNLDFLIWCYTNLRLGNFPNLQYVRWNQRESFYITSSNTIDKQIFTYIDGKMSKVKN